ncbi:MAG: DUF1801 domain-containing protein [Actinomycetota bacterium]|nr:DUF1801 domain-containing protein [Actinomycetota bacterium]
MSTAEVDRYIATFEQPQRLALERLRAVILQNLPDAEQGISYAIPAFRIKGKVIAGMAGYRNFVSYYPHSGSVIEQVGAAAQEFEGTRGALHFALNKPIPKRLVKQLIQVKLATTFKQAPDIWVEHGLSAPARRALAGAGIAGLKELRKVDLAAIAELHGIGPNAMKVLSELKQAK